MAAVAAGLPRGDVLATRKDLAGQAEHSAGVGVDGQGVVAEIAAPVVPLPIRPRPVSEVDPV